MEAPASNAACVLSICSEIVIGTAGLSAFCGTEPVMATQMIQGFVIEIEPLRRKSVAIKRLYRTAFKIKYHKMLRSIPLSVFKSTK
jgi:hypothetical protein